MARTLTSPAATEAAKTSGAFPRHILEIQWGGGTGTLYYSDEDLTSPVTASGRVLEWGQIQSQGEPGKVGGHGQVSIRLADPTLSLKSLIEAKPGPQNKFVYIHLWFEGTTWPTDRITIFGGVMDAPLAWEDKTGSWQLNLKGLEVFYNRLMGRYIDRDIFSDVICGECEGEIIPICYGRPVARVPACPVQRPGQAMLFSTLNQFDTHLYIHNSSVEQLFTVDSNITIIVGYPNNFETITGAFNNAGDRTEFEILTRSSVQASGSCAGLFGSGGRQYVLIPAADVTNPTVSRGGYPISFFVDAAWVTTLITEWEQTGDDIIVCDVGDLGLDGNEPYQIGAYPGQLAVWPNGTPVYEVAPWVYIVNWLPSESIDVVEAKGAVNLPGGGTLDAFLAYDPSQYTYYLDDKSLNSALGRHPTTDPGVTSIVLNGPPAYYGFTDNRLYVTLKGVTNDGTPTGTALWNPADVIYDLLTNPFIGNVPSGSVNASSFTTAAADIPTVFAFVINKPLRLMDVCGELAFQAMSLLFWDGGVANMQALSNTLSSPALTIDEGEYSKGTLKLEEQSLKEVPTQVSGSFRLSCAASQDVKLIRTSNEAIGYYGRREENLNLWGYQAPTSVALVLEFWLLYRLQLNQLVNLDSYLNVIELQPGDVIQLGVTNGTGLTILNSILARVRSLRHTPASAAQRVMEKIQVVAEASLWTFDIEVLVPTTRNCNAPGDFPYQSGAPDDAGGAGIIALPRYTPGIATGDEHDPGFGDVGDGSGGSGAAYPRLAKTNALIAKGASGNVTLYTGIGAGSSTGIVVAPYNVFGGCQTSGAIGSGKYVWVDRTSEGYLYLVAGEQ